MVIDVLVPLGDSLKLLFDCLAEEGIILLLMENCGHGFELIPGFRGMSRLGFLYDSVRRVHNHNVNDLFHWFERSFLSL